MYSNLLGKLITFNVNEVKDGLWRYSVCDKKANVYLFLLIITCALFMLSIQFDILKTNTKPESKIYTELVQYSQTLRNQTVVQIGNNLQQRQKNTTEKIKILIWYGPYGRRTKKKNVIPEECGQCDITYNLVKINQPETKAVVFHFKELVLKTMPKKRRIDQFYVWWSEENPKAMKENGVTLANFDKVFNLTMTYRRDSDIYSPYGTAMESHQYSNQHYHFHTIDDILKMKTKTAIWIVSNCGKHGDVYERMELAKNLVKNRVEIDRFGDCFGRRVGKDDVKELIEMYKFYFAFENSQNCKDYITEKFFRNSLKYGAVPVVFGAKKSDYEAVAPPNSYIYANDFKVEELANYLIHLNENDDAYARYHMWRFMEKEKMPFYGTKTKWCQLCQLLRRQENNKGLLGNDQNYQHFQDRPKVVHSLAEWVYGMENNECLNYSSRIL